jgi:hypothetical protein
MSLREGSNLPLDTCNGNDPSSRSAWTDAGDTMGKLQEFQFVARLNGYAEVCKSTEGSIVWFRKTAPDADTNAHKRLCIDSVTDSATAFWDTVPARHNSKTFRTVAALKEWFGSTLN